MQDLRDARRLATYVDSLPNFAVIKSEFTGYHHVGATLTDTVLQSGLNYKTVVEPRVRHVLDTYPSAVVTSGLLKLIGRYGSHTILKWEHPDKPKRLESIVSLLVGESIETETELRRWLAGPRNVAKLGLLPGIGPKTIDYLKNLLGFSTISVDRHVRTFVRNAGLDYADYDALRQLVSITADLLGIRRSDFDKSIWSFCSTVG